MVKEFHIRLLFIPLLGILIPFASHIITYTNYSFAGLAVAHLYFILCSFCIWTGSNMAHKYLRKRFAISRNIFSKIAAISFISTLYSSVIGGLLTFLWLRFSDEHFTWSKLLGFTIYTSLAVTVFTLMYEVLFLNTEKEQHIKIVNDLDKELASAETAILRNEIDPHFIFNSLTTLNHLITTNPEKAASYNENLAQVYKYVLQNKNNKTVTLLQELDFIKDYFSLLKIRFEQKLSLSITTNAVITSNLLIVPCALQVLIENAIKHNEFSEEDPLHITVEVNEEFLMVSNNVLSKPLIINSTETGLKNLSTRYKLISDQDICIHKNGKLFSVTVPVFSIIKPYNHAQSHHY